MKYRLNDSDLSVKGICPLGKQELVLPSAGDSQLHPFPLKIKGTIAYRGREDGK